MENRKFEVDVIVIKSITAKSNLPTLKKLELFNQHSDLFDYTDIDEFLLSLDKPYSSIAMKGQRPLIDNNQTTKKFVSILKEKEYISRYKFEKRLLRSGIRVITFRK